MLNFNLKIRLAITAVLCLVLSVYQVNAQLNVGSASAPNGDAMLQITSSNKGLLLPTVALVGINSPAPLAANVAGMVVFNTAISGTGSNAVSPGIYVNDGMKWNTFTNMAFTPEANFTSGTINCANPLNGTYTQFTDMNSSNTKVITITSTSTGTYSATTDQQNGVTFSVSNTLYKAQNITQITLVASGTPINSGVFTYTVSMAGQTCTFNVTYGVAQTAYTLDCAVSTVATGGYNTGVAMTGSNTKVVTVNVTARGPYTLSTPTVNGISFASSGTFSTFGSQTVTLAATGIPTSGGTFVYPVSGAGQSCNFSVTTVSTFTSQIIFTGSVSSWNGQITNIPFNSISGETSNFGADAGIVSGGNFVAPATGTYTFSINSIATNYAGVNRYDVQMNTASGGRMFNSDGTPQKTSQTVAMNKGDLLPAVIIACWGCQPTTNAVITSLNVQVTLQ